MGDDKSGGMIHREHNYDGATCWCAPEMRVYPEGDIVVHNVLVNGDWHDKACQALRILAHSASPDAVEAGARAVGYKIGRREARACMAAALKAAGGQNG